MNDEELEAENDDHNLEVDDEDTVASNEEKYEEDVDNEEVVDDEEVEDEEDDQKPQNKAVTSPSLNVQSGITESIATPVLVSSRGPIVSDFDSHHIVQQRLLPSTEVITLANTKLESPQSSLVGTTGKRKRPLHQLKKHPSPNPHSVDFSGSGYPYLPDATKVMPSSIPPMQIGYSGGPLPQESTPSVTTTASGGFKSMTVVPLPPVGFPATSPAPYRSANKVTVETAAVSAPQPPTYLTPQVQQVYQTAPPANYSSYPIDYATTTAQLPPSSTVAFRNVVATPSSSLELPLMPTTQQSAGVTTGGDSEFGGLVSYFSSQQEDDFDT